MATWTHLNSCFTANGQCINSCIWTYEILLTFDSGECHCVESARIWVFSGPYFPAFGLNTERESILSSHFNIIWLCYAETYSPFCFSSNLDFLSIRMLGPSFPTSTGFIYRLDDYLKLFYMGWKFQLSLFKPWWNFTWLYRDYIFFRITAILFLHCFHLSCKMKSHRVVKLNFQPDLEAVNYHHKAPHLGCCGSPRSTNDHFSTSNLTIPSLE